MTSELHGKVAVVTGAGSGIGRAAAKALADAGASVLAVDIDETALASTILDIEATGGEATAIHANVSVEEDVAKLIPACLATYGRLDCAFNNAGIVGSYDSPANCPTETWDRVIAVNLTGVFLCMRYELQHMLAHTGGSIVNASSISGLSSISGRNPAYVASKHGIIGLTKAAARAHGAAGVRINAVCPGFVDTPLVDEIFASKPSAEERAIALHPIGRIGRAQEIANMVVWLCSDKASFVNGSALRIDGGVLA